MPDPYWPKRKGSFTLADVHRLGYLVRITCRYCKTGRNYVPDDLRTLFGPIEVDDVPYQMRCAKCGKRHTLEIETLSPSAADRQTMIIRRIDKIAYVRRVTWRDVRGR
jgi:hypothetical protein